MREKQIEEMTKITFSMYCRDKEKKCAGVQECDMKCLQYQRCEALYNAGYRKQSEVIDEFVKMLKDTSMTKWDYHEAVDVEEIDRIAAKMKGGEG